mmetsp:Transcript_37530/g.63947  ORF Transcript_37530/g.63947 Transcript_37530/m.63947 type:complete len:285 (+) Transcript_37530:226-1080(+)
MELLLSMEHPAAPVLRTAGLTGGLLLVGAGVRWDLSALRFCFVLFSTNPERVGGRWGQSYHFRPPFVYSSTSTSSSSSLLSLVAQPLLLDPTKRLADAAEPLCVVEEEDLEEEYAVPPPGESGPEDDVSAPIPTEAPRMIETDPTGGLGASCRSVLIMSLQASHHSRSSSRHRSPCNPASVMSWCFNSPSLYANSAGSRLSGKFSTADRAGMVKHFTARNLAAIVTRCRRSSSQPSTWSARRSTSTHASCEASFTSLTQSALVISATEPNTSVTRFALSSSNRF